MRALILAILALGCGGQVFAESLSLPAVDTSRFVTQAMLPAPCATVQLPDTLIGTAGTMAPCTPRADAARPTVVQAAIVTTDAGGSWSVAWAKGFASASPYVDPQAINVGGAQPYICNVASSTSSSATGKCWQTLTTTLPSIALSLLGLVVNPTGASASIQVRIAARDVTQ